MPMGLYNFKPQFLPMILDGTKTHTIRAPRKGSQDVPGNTMHLYTGLRTKKAKLLGRFKCAKVEAIQISSRVSFNPSGTDSPAVVWVDGSMLHDDEMEQLARRDGFRHMTEMMDFWKGRLPFKGFIFHWKYDPKAVNRNA
jgi:hypothetical protein